MTALLTALRAVLYLRISSDRDGDALGVERQREDCLNRAEREGWTVVGEYVDNDKGASTKSTKKRPEYDRMIGDAKAGKFDVILGYSASRLTRRPKEYETLIELSERHKVQIRTVASGDADFSTADGRAVARTIAAWDAAEAERIGERVSRKVRENVKAGKFLGGRRPFGFESDGMTIRESEAEEIRNATATVLRGGSLRSIALDLNSRGVKTSVGKNWSPLAVRDLLRRPRNSGMVKYAPTEWDEDQNGNKARKVNRSHEAVGKAAWDAIVTEDERLAVVAILADPERKTSPGNQPTYLGSSVYLCGVCGSKVRTSASGGRATRYVCNGGKGTGPNHLSRNANKTDDLVNTEMVEWLTAFIGVNKLMASKPGASVTPEWSRLSMELTAVQARATELQEDYADGYLSRAEFRSAVDRNRDREAQIREEMDRLTAPSNRLPMFDNVETPEEVPEKWEALSIEEKRKVVATALQVSILPTEKRGPVFDPASVQVTPKLNPLTLVGDPDVPEHDHADE